MSSPKLPAELPERDPGIPRFVWLTAVLALLLASGSQLRPAELRGPGQIQAGESGPAQGEDLAAYGARLFVAQGCGECHATAGGDGPLGPSLSGLLARAQARVGAPDYQGKASSAEAYVAEAALDHCLDPLPGYACPDLTDLALRLSIEDGEALARYLLATEREDPSP